MTPSAIVSEGDNVAVRYRGGHSFELEIMQQGKKRLFQTLEYSGPNGRQRVYSILITHKLANGSYEVEAPGVVFNITEANNETGTATIRWNGTDSEAIIPIPDDIKLRYGYY